MLSVILILLGIAITVIGAYSIIGLGIHISNRHLFRSKVMTDIILPGSILLFVLFDIFLWAIWYHIHCMLGG